MHELMSRTKSANANQFGKWFDSSTRHWSRVQSKHNADSIEAQRAGTQEDSKKWYRIVRGEQALSERGLQDLQRLFPDAVRYFDEGPDRLWEAMWGDVDSLWSICGALVHAYEFPDPARKIDKSTLSDPSPLELVTGPELSFEESLNNFEGSLLSYRQFGHEISLRDLSESIALSRLHAAVNRLCKTDGVGAYRCVRLCLDDEGVSLTLKALGEHSSCIDIYETVSKELADTEIRRLQEDPSYRESVGVTDLVGYACNPAAFCSNEARVEALQIG